MRIARKISPWSLLLIIVIVLGGSISAASAASTISKVTAQVSYAQLHAVQFIGYAPAKLVITYPHTTSVSSNVSSLSGGSYSYNETTSSPSTMTFYLSASDIYTIFFVIMFPVPESGNLSWAMYSPGFLPQTGEAYINSSTAVGLTFIAELLQQQHYPTADEIANATAAILLNELTLQNQILQHQVQADHQQIIFDSEVNSITVSAALVSSIIALVFARRFVSVNRRVGQPQSTPHKGKSK